MTSHLVLKDGSQYKMELVYHDDLGFIGIIWTPDNDLVVCLSPEEASITELIAMQRTINKLQRWRDEQEILEHGEVDRIPDPVY